MKYLIYILKTFDAATGSQGTRPRSELTYEDDSISWGGTFKVKVNLVYKSPLLAFKCIQSSALEFLCMHAHPSLPVSPFPTVWRPSSARTEKYDEHAFQHCVPRLWNLLPLYIGSVKEVCDFKIYSKIHLLWEAYCNTRIKII